jgi:hypothetical protein
VSGGRTAGYALLGLAGLLFAFAVLSGWSGAQRYASREDETRAVRAAAAAFVAAYGSFDHRTQDAYAPHLAALTTGELQEALTNAAIDPDAVRLERVITTEIVSVTVTSLADDVATADVTAEQTRRWVDPVLGHTLHALVVQRITCRLLREEGGWLVAELRLQSQEPARPGAR